ncbi:hypothetical protein Tco_1007052 [Tanacetum coccineum]|uniref:Uncharacterized protein n=1 Tax=Tanacetum coccineum TaxID=301880 RepID=A0ABQ5FKA1_9ASTR
MILTSNTRLSRDSPSLQSLRPKPFAHLLLPPSLASSSSTRTVTSPIALFKPKTKAPAKKASLLGEAVTGKGILQQLNLETGIPIYEAEPLLLFFILFTLPRTNWRLWAETGSSIVRIHQVERALCWKVGPIRYRFLVDWRNHHRKGCSSTTKHRDRTPH